MSIGRLPIYFFLVTAFLVQSCSDDETGEINYHIKKVYNGTYVVYTYTYTSDGRIQSIKDSQQQIYNFFYRPDGKLDSIGNAAYRKKYHYQPNGDLEYTFGNQTPDGSKIVYILENGRVRETYTYNGEVYVVKRSYTYSENGYLVTDSTVIGENLYFGSSQTYTYITDREPADNFPLRTYFSDEALTFLPAHWMEESCTRILGNTSPAGTLTTYSFDQHGRVVKQKFTGVGGLSDYEFNFSY